LGFITAIIAVPFQFGTSAASEKKSGLYVRTESGNDGLAKMWDIREQSGDEFTEALARFRQTVGMDATRVADVRDGFVRGEQTFRQQHPGAKVEYNLDIRTPEILTPDVYEQSVRWLTSPTTANRATVLRDFIKGYNDLIGLSDTQIDALKTAANYANPDGNLSYVRLEQEINGIPVFRGEMTAGSQRRLAIRWMPLQPPQSISITTSAPKTSREMTLSQRTFVSYLAVVTGQLLRRKCTFRRNRAWPFRHGAS